jgi:hypothetical protein
MGSYNEAKEIPYIVGTMAIKVASFLNMLYSTPAISGGCQLAGNARH